MFNHIGKFLFIAFILCCSVSQINSLNKKKSKAVKCKKLTQQTCSQNQQCEFRDGKCQGKGNAKNDLTNVDLKDLHNSSPNFLELKNKEHVKNHKKNYLKNHQEDLSGLPAPTNPNSYDENSDVNLQASDNQEESSIPEDFPVAEINLTADDQEEKEVRI